MKTLVEDIVRAVQTRERKLNDVWISKRITRYNATLEDSAETIGKLDVLAFYLNEKNNNTELWQSWALSAEDDQHILQLLRLKPRRSASGVATITVLTMPHACSSNCVYCPSDIRMPKSYLSSEPACQRAERNYFDPYLQVRARLKLLESNGHVTDKIELIVLGGTWSDYDESYQLWFMTELFSALNDSDEDAERICRKRERFYQEAGLSADPATLAESLASLQASVSEGQCSYNQAISKLYSSAAWQTATRGAAATLDELLAAQVQNEGAQHRVVGLCIETRPDLITQESTRFLRQLGCTKIQMGIQSLNQEVLDACGRTVTIEQIADAFATLRLFGYKILVHMMLNLVGATPESDLTDYRLLVKDERFQPDEIKLYPCVLVESSQLRKLYEAGAWTPYSEEKLIALLAKQLEITPAYVRISRMIRDISSHDILAGNKKSNLRQLVERMLDKPVQLEEIRQREIATESLQACDLSLERVYYRSSVSDEVFLQWVSKQNTIAGFLRLSLPHEGSVAMIREVHVYGRVAELGSTEEGAAQHLGLGKQLIDHARSIAGNAGYARMDVISSVGTRNYYRRLGFYDNGLYQSIDLDAFD